MAKYMNQKEYAAYRGVSSPYIFKLKTAGRLVFNADGKVDVAASDALIAKTGGSRPHIAEMNARRREEIAASKPAKPPKEIAVERMPDLEHGEKGAAASDLRRQREEAKRQMKLIELGIMRGALLERADVDHVATDLGVTLRATLDAAVERLTPRLSSASSSGEIADLARDELTREWRRINRALVRAARDLQTRDFTSGE